MDTQQYILSFNFEEISSQVESISRSYTELGSTIRGISGKVSEDVEALKLKVSSVTSTLNLLSSTLATTFVALRGNLVETSGILDEISKHSKTIADNFSHIPAAFGGLGPDKSKDTMSERLQDIVPASKGDEAGSIGKISDSDEVNDADKKDKAEMDKAEEDSRKRQSAFLAVIEREARSAKSGVGNILSRASMGGLGGGIIGGALTAMILGYSERNRQQTERGEVLNVMEATGERLFTKPIQKATRQFSAFQEKAQFYYGIGRKETQGVMKQMVDSGYSANEMLERYDKKLGEVGENTVTLTLGLDKHLNLASGTSMQHIMKLTSEYGDTLKEASNNIVLLSRTAQQSGAGINRFIDSVMSGSAALTQYGVDLKDVVNLTSQLEKHYTEMGLGKQFAGQLATSAMQGITSGISGFDQATKMRLGGMISPGKEGFAALQSFEEGWQAVRTGEDKGRLVKTLNAMRELQEEVVGGAPRETKIQFWKERGLSSLGATTFVDEAAKGSFDRLNNNSEEANKTWKGLKDAFKTESEQVSELQKDQRDIIKGLARVGEGLLQLVGGLLGVVITGIRSMPALVAWAVEMIKPLGDKAKANRIMDAIIATQDKQFAAVSAGADKFGVGLGDLSETALGKIFKVLGSNLKSAVKEDFSGTPKGQEAEAAARESAEEQEDFAFQRRALATAVRALDAITPGDTPWLDIARDQEMKAKEHEEYAAGQRLESDRLKRLRKREETLRRSKKGRAGPYDMNSAEEASYEARIPMLILPGEELLSAVNVVQDRQVSGAAQGK